MKILQVSNFFKPLFEAGGVARSAYSISKSLVDMGHEVTIYTTYLANRSVSHTNIETNRPLIIEGMKIYYFSNLRKYFSLPPIPYYLPIVARKEIKNFDIIHIHEYRTLLAVIVSHYARKYGIPYVMQPRGSAQKIHKIYSKTIFDTIFGYKILKGTNEVILSSKNEYLLAKPIFDKAEIKAKSKFTYMPNGVNLSDYHKLPSNSQFRNRYSIDSDTKIILYLGRIHKRKGLDILVKAYKNVIKDYIDSKLVIVGPTTGYINELKSLISSCDLEDNVMLLNGLYGDDKLSAYVAADVFVLPSEDEQESFGNVVLEASACGTPSVVTKVCGVSEWMKNIQTVEPNVSSLGKGIIDILKDNPSKKGEKAKEETKNLTWDRIAEKSVSIYKETIQNLIIKEENL